MAAAASEDSQYVRNSHLDLAASAWDKAVSMGYKTQLLTPKKVRTGSTWAFHQTSL